MALTFLTANINNPYNGKHAIKHRFLVDSGAVYTVIPSELLKSLR